MYAVLLYLQHLLSAQAVNASTAAQLTDSSNAVLVSYGTAGELSAAAEALGVPLVVDQGVKYCYSLPSTPPTRHCQVSMQPRHAVAGNPISEAVPQDTIFPTWQQAAATLQIIVPMSNSGCCTGSCL
jgi:hypothetical protein